MSGQSTLSPRAVKAKFSPAIRRQIVSLNLLRYISRKRHPPLALGTKKRFCDYPLNHGLGTSNLEQFVQLCCPLCQGRLAVVHGNRGPAWQCDCR